MEAFAQSCLSFLSFPTLFPHAPAPTRPHLSSFAPSSGIDLAACPQRRLQLQRPRHPGVAVSDSLPVLLAFFPLPGTLDSHSTRSLAIARQMEELAPNSKLTPPSPKPVLSKMECVAAQAYGIRERTGNATPTRSFKREQHNFRSSMLRQQSASYRSERAGGRWARRCYRCNTRAMAASNT